MANRPKQIGTEWETRCARWLQENGYPWAERRALAGALDKGDLMVPGLMIECKAEQRIDLPGYMREVRAQTANCPQGTLGFAWVKARGKPVDESFIVLNPPSFFPLIR